MSRIKVDDIPATEDMADEDAKEISGGLQIKMKNIMITSYQTSGSGMDDGAVDEMNIGVGEKGGTEDINIGVGELQEDTTRKS